MVDTYRLLSRGEYDNDFSFLNYNSSFPTKEVRGRNCVYKFRHKQYTGEYAYNKNLVAMINGVQSEIPYKVISVNYFKLITDKMTDIAMNNDIAIKTGDSERDQKVIKLIEDKNWKDSIRKAFKLCTEYGDSCIKTYTNGCSVLSPLNCFKVVDRSNIDRTIAYVLYEPIYTKYNSVETLEYIRFEIHFKGKIYEICKYYNGGSIGIDAEIEYHGRVIPRGGQWYNTGIDDCELVQWCCINQEADGVYGESLYQSIQDIVFAIEQRISVNAHALDASLNPFIIIGADMVHSVKDPNTGIERIELKLINDKFVLSAGDVNVKTVELNYNLENSEHMINILQGYLYELSEMGKTYLSGEYSGNISEETLNNTIKSAIDKANRLINEMYNSFRDSLYCLCRLNGIEVNRSDITIIFNVGRTDDDKTVAEICKTCTDIGLFSKHTLREKYYGYNKEQSEAEDEQIRKENELNTENTSLADSNINNTAIKEDSKNEGETQQVD